MKNLFITLMMLLGVTTAYGDNGDTNFCTDDDRANCLCPGQDPNACENGGPITATPQQIYQAAANAAIDAGYSPSTQYSLAYPDRMISVQVAHWNSLFTWSCTYTTTTIHEPGEPTRVIVTVSCHVE